MATDVKTAFPVLILSMIILHYALAAKRACNVVSNQVTQKTSQQAPTVINVVRKIKRLVLKFELSFSEVCGIPFSRTIFIYKLRFYGKNCALPRSTPKIIHVGPYLAIMPRSRYNKKIHY